MEFPKTELLISQALEAGLFPALALSVNLDGREVYRRVEGSLDPENGGEETRATSLFDLASLTKVLSTTILAMRAREAGALRLEDRVGSFFPGAGARELTVVDILKHSSGLPAVPALQRFFPDPTRIDRAEAIDHLLALEPETPPGQVVLYSCTGFLILGLILEKLYDLSLGRLFEQEIARPLGLEAHLGPVDPRRAAATETCPWRARRMRGEVHDESAFCLGGEAGNAGLFASLEDVRALAPIFLDEGLARGLRILSPESIRLMTRLQTPGLNEARGLGFLLHGPETQDGPSWPETAFGHTGFTGTSLFFEPQRRLFVASLTNRVYGGREATALALPRFRKAIHGAILEELDAQALP